MPNVAGQTLSDAANALRTTRATTTSTYTSSPTAASYGRRRRPEARTDSNPDTTRRSPSCDRVLGGIGYRPPGAGAAATDDAAHRARLAPCASSSSTTTTASSSTSSVPRPARRRVRSCGATTRSTVDEAAGVRRRAALPRPGHARGGRRLHRHRDPGLRRRACRCSACAWATRRSASAYGGDRRPRARAAARQDLARCTTTAPACSPGCPTRSPRRATTRSRSTRRPCRRELEVTGPHRERRHHGAAAPRAAARGRAVPPRVGAHQGGHRMLANWLAAAATPSPRHRGHADRGDGRADRTGLTRARPGPTGGTSTARYRGPQEHPVLLACFHHARSRHAEVEGPQEGGLHPAAGRGPVPRRSRSRARPTRCTSR